MSTSTSGSPAAKRARSSSSKLIVTHNGTFHADEALAVYLVRKLEQFRDADLKRTRDPKIIETGDIVLDVGGEYIPSTHRYDHHQRGFTETFSPEHKTKLSSAGLVYKHFGRQILEQELAAADGNADDTQKLDVLYKKLYENFIEALDGIDNGIQQYEGVSKYSSRTDLSSRVAHLNPSWNEATSDSILDSKFERASKLAGTEFDAALNRAARSWYPARSLVESAVTSRKQHDPSGRLIVFEEFAPWKEHLFLLEDELKIPESEQPFYVIYPDESGKWRVQAVPQTPESFQSRKALPEAWRGVRDQALSDLTGIPGCIFVHASGFIGGNATREGALEMVKKALLA